MNITLKGDPPSFQTTRSETEIQMAVDPRECDYYVDTSTSRWSIVESLTGERVHAGFPIDIHYLAHLMSTAAQRGRLLQTVPKIPTKEEAAQRELAADPNEIKEAMSTPPVWVPDEDWSDEEESISLPNLSVPIHLRNTIYFDGHGNPTFVPPGEDE